MKESEPLRREYVYQHVYLQYHAHYSPMHASFPTISHRIKGSGFLSPGAAEKQFRQQQHTQKVPERGPLRFNMSAQAAAAEPIGAGQDSKDSNGPSRHTERVSIAQTVLNKLNGPDAVASSRHLR
jgi:hypothetical protein